MTFGCTEIYNLYNDFESNSSFCAGMNYLNKHHKCQFSKNIINPSRFTKKTPTFLEKYRFNYSSRGTYNNYLYSEIAPMNQLTDS